MDEATIFDGLKADDKKAWGLLYDLLYERVYFFTRHLVGEKMEAEDIAISSLVKFWEKGPESFENFRHIKSYIFSTAKNAAIDYLRQTKVQKSRQQDFVLLNKEVEESIAERANHGQSIAEMLQLLTEEIEKLPEQCRETFKLVVMQKIPRPVVAEKLNVSLSTVHNNVAYAKKKLQRVFSEKELIILLLLLSCEFSYLISVN